MTEPSPNAKQKPSDNRTRNESGYLTTPLETTDMPKGIPYIIGNEAAERFSFYGMKAILMAFMTKHLVDSTGADAHMTRDEAAVWVHGFGAAVYFFPIVGAILADWLLGKYRLILSLSLLYCVGHGLLALMDTPLANQIDPREFLWWGLACIAVGAGGIKPCVSAHVGDQFGTMNQFRLSRVFSWFYFSINLGATASMFASPLVLRHWGPGWAFGIPGILMAIATVAFWMGRKVFIHVPPGKSDFFRETFSRDGIRAMVNLIPLYLLISPFWALFDQTGSTWVDQADKMNKTLDFGFFEYVVPPSQIQMVNSVFVLILIPTFAYLVYPYLGRFFRVTPLRRIGIGLFLTAPAFMIAGWVETRILAGQTPHISWQVLAYLFITAAEILVSITALEFSYTQAPKKMKSFIMGLFFLSVTLGNLVTAGVNAMIPYAKEKGWTLLIGANYFWFFVWIMLGTAVLFVIWSQFYRGQVFIQGEEDRKGSGSQNEDLASTGDNA